MRRLTVTIAAIAMLAMALPAIAAEPACVSLTINHDAGPRVETFEWQEGAPFYAVVGLYVWFDFHETPSAGQLDTVSYDVSDPSISAAAACADGSVELTRAPAITPDPEPSPVVTQPDHSTAFCDFYEDTLERYCQLPNRITVIS